MPNLAGPQPQDQQPGWPGLRRAASPRAGPGLPPTIQKRARAQPARAEQVVEGEIVLYEVDDAEATSASGDLQISSDVSFPLEVQEQTSLADQLDKLNRLR